MNCWIAPGFDPIAMRDDLIRIMQGPGGYVDQSLMYLETDNAAKWLAYERQSDYVQMYGTIPLEQAAQAVMGCIGGAGLDVIALGPGGGQREVRLVQHLLDLGAHDAHLNLLDISQPLLWAAYRHAADTLMNRGVALFAGQGNFHHVSRYGQLMYRPEGVVRKRIVLMLGGTFGNLLHEPHFVRDSLGGLLPGDLLLIDVGLVPQTTGEDPRLGKSHSLPDDLRAAFEDWLTAPLCRYGGMQRADVVVRPQRNTATTIAGSYSVDQVASLKDGREFRMTTVRRYEVEPLAQALRSVGWEHVQTLPFGFQGAMAHPRALLLFQKGEAQPFHRSESLEQGQSQHADLGPDQPAQPGPDPGEERPNSPGPDDDPGDGGGRPGDGGGPWDVPGGGQRLSVRATGGRQVRSQVRMIRAGSLRS